jgi:hypothetical protein
VLLDANTVVFPIASLIELLVGRGAWRLRQYGSAWQEHSPNSDWTDLPTITVRGRVLRGLSDSWGWRLAGEAPSPSNRPVAIPRPRRERRSVEPAMPPTVSA